MQIHKRSVLCAASIFIRFLLTLGQNIETSFDVRADCTNDQRQLLDVFVEETIELIDTALSGINDFDKDEQIRHHLVSYLGTKQSQANKNINLVVSKS